MSINSTPFYPNESDFIFVCSFESSKEFLYLLTSILFAVTGTIILVANLLCLIFYLRYKAKNEWKWSDIDLLLILFYDIVCGLVSYFTSVSFCIRINSLESTLSCIAKYCLIYFIVLDLAKLSLINGCERLLSIRLSKHTQKHLQQKHSKLISFLKPAFRIGMQDDNFFYFNYIFNLKYLKIPNKGWAF